MSLLTRQQIFEAIEKERAYQDAKYGPYKQQSLPGFLLVAKKELDEAIDGWINNSPGRDSPLAELLQVASVCVAAMEKYGIAGNSFNTDDVADGSQAYQYQSGQLYDGL